MMLDPRYAWLRQLIALRGPARRSGRRPATPACSIRCSCRRRAQIGAALFDLFADGRIWPHLEATFTAALGGLALGIVVGIVLGVVAALVPAVAELLEPVMTLLNAIPRVILAPLFVIWLGIGHRLQGGACRSSWSRS